jgi:phage recombination protein Bet
MTAQAIELHSPAALAIRPGQQMWTDKQVAALAVLGIKGATKADLAVFMHYCQKTGLDPFSRQIYGIMRRVKENGQWTDKFTIQIGIDGFRVIRDRVAERLGVTVEYEDTIWYDADGGSHKVWLWDEPPAGCNVTVTKDGRRFPGVIRFSSYAQRAKDSGDLTGQWKTQPDHMIEKCAEAFALRRAFPNDLAGVYLEDEMPAQDGPAVIRSRGRVTVAEVIEQPDGEAPERPVAAVPDETPASGPAAATGSGSPEDEPGSASKDQLTSLHIILGTLGFGTDDREQKLRIAETITGHAPLTGPVRGRSSKNLSFTEARKLTDTLEGFGGDREKLIAFMAEREQDGDSDG